MQKPKPGYKPLFLNKFSVILSGEYPQEWNFSTLGDETSGKFSNGVNNDKEDYGEGTLFVNISDVFREFTIDPRKLKRVNVSKEEIENYKLQKGDLVIDRSSNIFDTVGYPSYFPGWDEPVVFSGFTFRYRPNSEYWNSKFLTYQLMSFPIRKFVISIGTKSANSNVNQNSYKKIVIPCPSLEEQQKITSILSTVDELINHYDKVIDSTKKLKKGLMQTLLTKGIGHKKFRKVKWLFGKEIKIPEEWKVVRLEEISKIIDSLHITPEYSSEGFPMIRSTEIKHGDLKLENALKVTKQVYDMFTKNHRPQRNDIVMSRVGTYFVISFVNTNELFCMGQNTLIIHPKIDPFFLYSALNSTVVNTQIEYLYDRTSGQKTLSLENIKKLQLFLPTSMEQEKISSLFRIIDSKISELKFKKSNLEKIKKGLMQKLLTGQIRVTV